MVPARRSSSAPVKAAVPVFSRVCAASSRSTGAPLRRHCSLRWRSSSSPDGPTAQCSVQRWKTSKATRLEEGRVGKEWCSEFEYSWTQEHSQKNKTHKRNL